MSWRRFLQYPVVATAMALRQVEDSSIRSDEPPHTHKEVPEFEPQKPECELGLDGVRVHPSLFVGGTTANLIQSISTNMCLLSSSFGGTASPNFTISIREGSPSLLKPRQRGFNIPGILSRPPLRGARIRIQFDNVADGVRIFVPISIPLETRSEALVGNPFTGRMDLLETDQYGNATRFKRVKSRAVSPQVSMVTTTTDGQAFAVYEVSRRVKSTAEFFHLGMIPVYVAFNSHTARGLPGLGQTTAIVSFALPGPADVQPIFIEASLRRNAFSINAVTSTLLFPFTTNQNGRDTHISITNASSDSFGTEGQAGKVTLYYYGGTQPGNRDAPPPNTTLGSGARAGIVPAGGQLVFTLSSGGEVTNCAALKDSTTTIAPTPNFQGYIIAVCQFQYCHGFAFITGAGEASPGYLAVAIDRGGEPPKS